MTEKKLTMRQIADRIDAHLSRFEADPKINAPRGTMNISPYYHAGASYPGSGAYISICYVSFQNTTYVKRADAEKYLAWLDAGNVGRHYEALR